MSVTIGTKYHETRASLIQKIREGEISALEDESDKNHWCILCVNKIKGKMYEMPSKEIINGEEHNSIYYAHESCYQEAKSLSQLKLFINEYFSRNKNKYNN